MSESPLARFVEELRKRLAEEAASRGDAFLDYINDLFTSHGCFCEVSSSERVFDDKREISCTAYCTCGEVAGKPQPIPRELGRELEVEGKRKLYSEVIEPVFELAKRLMEESGFRIIALRDHEHKPPYKDNYFRWKPADVITCRDFLTETPEGKLTTITVCVPWKSGGGLYSFKFTLRTPTAEATEMTV